MSNNRKEQLLELFQNNNGSDLSDAELLEMLFLIVNPHSDSKKLSEEVLQKFGNFIKAINAPNDKLFEISSISENGVALLKLIGACGKRVAQEVADKQEASVLARWNDFIDFCRQNMAYENVEEFRIFLLDKHFRCFDNKVISRGTVNQTYAHPRDVVQISIKAKAVHIILAHNHPSGDCKPSEEDNFFTNMVLEASQETGIDIFDHLIITDKQVYSYRENGFFAKNPKE